MSDWTYGRIPSRRLRCLGMGLARSATLFPNFTKTIEILAQRPENAHNDFPGDSV